MDNTKTVEKACEQVQLRSLVKDTGNKSFMKQKLLFVDNRPVVQLQKNTIAVMQRKPYTQNMSQIPYDPLKTTVSWNTETIEGTKVATSMDARLGADHIQGYSPKSDSLKPLFSKLPTKSEGKSANMYYIRGHLLNDNLGGPGENFNLFPITQDANGKHEHEIENIVKDWVNNKKQYVHYMVNIVPENFSKDSDETNFINSKLFCVAELLDPKNKNAVINKISVEIDSIYAGGSAPQPDITQYAPNKILSFMTHEQFTPLLTRRKDDLSNFHSLSGKDQSWVFEQFKLRLRQEQQFSTKPYIQQGLQDNLSVEPGQLLLRNIYSKVQSDMIVDGIYNLFERPIDPTIDQSPNYYEIIKSPMDMSAIEKKINRNEYTEGPLLLKVDIMLCLDNYILYNGPERGKPIQKFKSKLDNIFSELTGKSENTSN